MSYQKDLDRAQNATAMIIETSSVRASPSIPDRVGFPDRINKAFGEKWNGVKEFSPMCWAPLQGLWWDLECVLHGRRSGFGVNCEYRSSDQH